jgi:ABC-type uncharacterized transport system substrate-binding protein
MAQAHPHVFITPKAVVTINNHVVSQVNVEWDFDELASSLFLECAGTDNGEIWKLVFPELQLLADGSKAPRSGYYTNVEIDGVPIPNLVPGNFQANYVDGSLHCQFTLDINQNVDHTFKIWFNDPTIYNDFDTQQGNFQFQGQNDTEFVVQKQTQDDIDKIYMSF